MSVRVVERTISTIHGDKRAWLVEPTETLVVGAERLERFRAEGHLGSEVDREILAAVRAVSDPGQLVVFRGKSDGGQASWGFDPSLSRDEARELGYHLVLDQLPMYRRIVAAGVFALVHVDFGAVEAEAYQDGTRRARDEIEARSIAEVRRDPGALATFQVDRWILHNLTFFFTLDLDEVVESILRKQLPLLEDRIPHLRELVASLPASAIE